MRVVLQEMGNEDEAPWSSRESALAEFVIARAAVVKSAVASFKSTLGHVSISADCKKVEPAATTLAICLQ